MSLQSPQVKNKNHNFFRFKKIDGKYLLTNEIGRYVFLNEKDFHAFLNGSLAKNDTYKILEERGFLNQSTPYQKYKFVRNYFSRNVNLFNNPVPSLHIIVPTLRCNYRCIYCQASSRSITDKIPDMNLETAKSVVDFIFSVPTPLITIEFQGGEPLARWPVVKFIIGYSLKKNKKAKKKLNFALVTNLSLMTDQYFSFLKKNLVSICTSLDGPPTVHNKNRPSPFGNSYLLTTKWIKKIQEEKKRNSHEKGRPLLSLHALPTITKFSLNYPKEIVDEYVKWGFREIHLRNLSYLGRAKINRKKIGYSAQKFITFWKKALDYILLLNKKGVFVTERETRIMIQKILTDINPNYTDLNSPCGAVCGQLLYNFDGKILTCDEARMLQEETFVLGNVRESKFEDIILHPLTRTMLIASCLDNLSCDLCVYKPYCGVCPVKNYGYHGNLFPHMRSTDWCKIKEAQLDYIFKLIQDQKNIEIFKKWITFYPNNEFRT